MKQNEIMLNALSREELEDLLGEQHIGTSYDTPLRKDAFDLRDEEKMKVISSHFREIMLTLGLDLQDDSLRGTPKRVAKMFVKEIFSGLNPENKPAVALSDNKYNYNQMLVEKNITLYSNCEHHFVPIIGKAHIGYISSGKVIGIKNQSNSSILLTKAAGTGKAYYSNCKRIKNSFANRQRCSADRCSTFMCFFQGCKRHKQQYSYG
jgi:hypothetical protein